VTRDVEVPLLLQALGFLAELINDWDIAVVFTGAMRLASDPEPDGPGNLADALRVAADKRSRGYRALVVFAGLVINARGAWKMKRDQIDAFIAANGRPGEIAGDEVRMPPILAPHPIFSGTLEERVSLVKVYPSLTADMFAVATADGTCGAVVEAFAGAGGIPRHLQSALERRRLACRSSSRRGRRLGAFLRRRLGGRVSRCHEWI
jgi:L-asparaginase